MSSRRKFLLPLKSVQSKANPNPVLRVSRNAFNEAKTNKDSLSNIEVLRTKQQKYIMMDQKVNMIAKIARLEQLNNHLANDVENVRIVKSYKSMILETKRQIRQKRKDIKKLRNSDITASISENQEEIKVLYLETKRLTNEKIKLNQKIEEALLELQDMKTMIQPRRLARQKSKLQALKTMVQEAELGIDKLEHPEKYIQSYHEQMEREEYEEKLRKDLIKQIKQTRKKVKEEDKQIKEIDDQLMEIARTKQYMV